MIRDGCWRVGAKPVMYRCMCGHAKATIVACGLDLQCTGSYACATWNKQCMNICVADRVMHHNRAGGSAQAHSPTWREQIAHRRLGAINARLPPNSGSCSRLAASARCAATARRAVHRRTSAWTAAPSSSSGTRRDLARASRRTKATPSGSHRPPTSRQAAAPAPKELRVSVAALAASNLAQG